MPVVAGHPLEPLHCGIVQQTDDRAAAVNADLQIAGVADPQAAAGGGLADRLAREVAPGAVVEQFDAAVAGVRLVRNSVDRLDLALVVEAVSAGIMIERRGAGGKLIRASISSISRSRLCSSGDEQEQASKAARAKA